MPLKRMDNVLIVVDDLEAAKAFFIELGLTLEGQTIVEGPAVGTLIGLTDVRATLAMLRTPDGQGIELDKFHTPDAIRFGPVNAPVNALGIRRIMFAVDDVNAVVSHMCAHGADLIGEMQYGDAYRLAYIRGPEGIIVALDERLGGRAVAAPGRANRRPGRCREAAIVQPVGGAAGLLTKSSGKGGPNADFRGHRDDRGRSRREVGACLRIPERPEWGVHGRRAMKSVFAVECGERHSTTSGGGQLPSV